MYSVQAQVVFVLAAGTFVCPGSQTVLFTAINACVQLARFASAMTVPYIWSGGGIVATGLVCAACQAAVLVVAVAPLWAERRAAMRSAGQTAVVA